MGAVNVSPGHLSTATQGGPVSIYFLGEIIGGWIAHKYGRIDALFFGEIFASVGGATQSAKFILVARTVTRLDTCARLQLLLVVNVVHFLVLLAMSSMQISPKSLLSIVIEWVEPCEEYFRRCS
jgi:hypothetical protein